MEQNKREKIKHIVTQKAMGIILIVVAIVSCIASDDGTAAILMLPIGIFTTFTKEMVITDTYFFNNEEESE